MLEDTIEQTSGRMSTSHTNAMRAKCKWYNIIL